MKLSLAASSIFAAVGAGAGSAAASSDVLYVAKMGPDPTAVPANSGASSTGTAEFVVNTDGTVKMTIKYNVQDPSIGVDNPMIGIHIHSGNVTTNGPIVFGFCGQDPLPPFGGACNQANDESATYVGTICDMAPPAPCYNNGNSSAAEAAQALIAGEPSKFDDLSRDCL